MNACCRNTAEMVRTACADACDARASNITVLCDEMDPRHEGFTVSRSRAEALRSQAPILRTLPLQDIGVAGDRAAVLADALHGLMLAAQRIVNWDVELMEHSDDCPASQCPVCGGCGEGHDQVGVQCDSPGEQDQEEPGRTHAACDTKRCAVGQVHLLAAALALLRAVEPGLSARGTP